MFDSLPKRVGSLSPEEKTDEDSEDVIGERVTVAVIDYDATGYEENHNEIYFEDDEGNLIKSAILSPQKDRMLASALQKPHVPKDTSKEKLWQMYNDYCKKVVATDNKRIKQREIQKVFDKFLAEAF